MKKSIVGICDIVLYIIVYIVLQALCTEGAMAFLKSDQIAAVIVGQVSSAVLIVVIFAILHWTRFGFKFKKDSLPLFLFVALFALGTLFPTMWFTELSNIDMPEEYKELFKGIMSSPWGILAISILVPTAEEVIFRGAILRRLLTLFCPKSSDPETSFLKRYYHDALHWTAISISALLFALFHGNLAQGGHAFVIGLFLGWMFYRTNSILPGLLFHFVNNTMAVVLAKSMGLDEDAKLIEYCGGNATTMYVIIAISIIVTIVSLYLIIKNIGHRSAGGNAQQ